MTQAARGRCALAHVALGVVTLVALVSSHPREARADVDMQIGAAAGVSWMRTMPALKGPSTPTFARVVPSEDVPIGGSVTALGGSFALALVAEDRVVIPLLGGGFYSAIGTYDTVLTSIDGSIAAVRPWSAYEVDLLLPGIGYRMKHRRFMFSATLRTGLSWLHAGASVAGGADRQEVALSGFSPMLQAELEACRRLDPVTRVCAEVAPRIYDFGILNGATFGLRVEWGR